MLYLHNYTQRTEPHSVTTSSVNLRIADTSVQDLQRKYCYVKNNNWTLLLRRVHMALHKLKEVKKKNKERKKWRDFRNLTIEQNVSVFLI